MFLRVKDGFYAGQVREFSPQAGRALLDAGRAVNPFNAVEDTPEERAAAAKSTTAPKSGKAAKKERR